MKKGCVHHRFIWMSHEVLHYISALHYTWRSDITAYSYASFVWWFILRPLRLEVNSTCEG